MKIFFALLILTQFAYKAFASVQLDSLAGTAKVYEKSGEYRSGLMTRFQILNHPKATINDKYYAYSRIGDNYRLLGMADSSQFFLQKAISINNEFKLNRSEALANLRQLFMDKGDFSKALKLAINTLNIDYSNRDTINIVYSLSDLADVYSTMNKSNKAIEYNNKAIAIQKEINKDIYLERNYDNLGKEYGQINQFDKARYYLNLAYQGDSVKNNRFGQAFTLSHLGNIELLDKKYELSLSIYERSKAIFAEINNPLGYISSSIKIAHILVILKREQEAIDLLLDLLNYIGKKKDHNTLRVYITISDAFEQIQQPKKAYDFLLKYSILKDSLNNLEIERSTKNLLIKYETAEKEREIAKQELELKEADLRLNRLILWFTLLVLILSLLTVVYFYSSYRAKKRLQYTINQLNEAIWRIEQGEEIEESKQSGQFSSTNLLLSNLTDFERRLKAKLSSNQAFAYTVSHEMKRNLNYISRKLKTLKDEGFKHNKVDEISTNIDEYQLLVTKLLELSAIDKQNSILVEVSIKDIVDDVLSDMNLPYGVGIQVSPNLPTIVADVLLLKQAIANLFENAIKYSRKDASNNIWFNYELVGDQHVFGVKDEGVGIEKTSKEYFDPFVRLSPVSGQGVGLSIVKKVAEKHGGNVFAEPNPDKGATFGFTLPA